MTSGLSLAACHRWDVRSERSWREAEAMAGAEDGVCVNSRLGPESKGLSAMREVGQTICRPLCPWIEV